MITSRQTDLVERLTMLILKVIAFGIVCLGVVVLTGAWIYCAMHDRGKLAVAISTFGDAFFFYWFARLLNVFFFSRKLPPQVHTLPASSFLSKFEPQDDEDVGAE